MILLTRFTTAGNLEGKNLMDIAALIGSAPVEDASAVATATPAAGFPALLQALTAGVEVPIMPVLAENCPLGVSSGAPPPITDTGEPPGNLGPPPTPALLEEALRNEPIALLALLDPSKITAQAPTVATPSDGTPVSDSDTDVDPTDPTHPPSLGKKAAKPISVDGTQSMESALIAGLLAVNPAATGLVPAASGTFAGDGDGGDSGNNAGPLGPVLARRGADSAIMAEWHGARTTGNVAPDPTVAAVGLQPSPLKDGEIIEGGTQDYLQEAGKKPLTVADFGVTDSTPTHTKNRAPITVAGAPAPTPMVVDQEAIVALNPVAARTIVEPASVSPKTTGQVTDVKPATAKAVVESSTMKVDGPVLKDEPVLDEKKADDPKSSLSSSRDEVLVPVKAGSEEGSANWSGDSSQGSQNGDSSADRGQNAPNTDAIGASSKSTETRSAGHTSAQRIQVIQQVADRVEALAISRPREGVVIQLEPKDLGSVTLVVKRTANTIDAQMTASDDRVRDIMQTARPELGQVLLQRGLTLNDFTVRGASDTHQAGFSLDRQNQQEARQQAQSHAQHAARQQSSFSGSSSNVLQAPPTAFGSKTRSVDIWI